MPAADTYFTAFARVQGGNHAAVAAIAVELYRREHDNMPESLDVLAPDYLPAVPIDPFDGRPMRFVVNDDSYKIYSVGKDGVDDGGIMDQETWEPDFVFEVQLTPPQ